MATTAKVYIEGEIKSDNWMASIVSVRESLEWQRPFDAIDITINSFGGDFTEGLGIYDLIKSYNVPITTTVIGQCCSIATIIFMAGSSRLMSENATFMIHQTRGGGWGGTEEEIRIYADVMGGYNDRMAAIYSDGTGQALDAIEAYMSKDSYFTPDEALAAGFATAVIKPVQAKAYVGAQTKPTAAPVVNTPSTSNPNQLDPMKILATAKDRITASLNAIFSGKPIVAKKVTTEAGDELTIETVDGGDNYAEGDTVKKGEELAADGTYVVGNVTIVVEGGKIKILTASESEDVVTASAEETQVTTTPAPEGETADQKIARLELENEEQKKTITAMQGQFGTIQAKMGHLSQLVGSKESKDVKIPAPKPQNTPVSARATVESDEDTARAQMLEERKNRGLGITPAA